jgi:hypothetical protein
MILAAAGCNHIPLLRHSALQAPTASELMCQQVLDNVAMTHVEQSPLPYFCLLNQGSVLVETTGSVNLTLTWPKALTTQGMVLTPSLSRRSNNNWVMKPINGGDHLAAMRVVYGITTGQVAPDDPAIAQCCARMGTKYKLTCCDPCDIPPPGWYCVGPKHAVPRHAPYVGHYGDTYVWVVPGGEDSLSRLTFAILAIAMEGNVKSTKGGRGGGEGDSESSGINPVESLVPAFGI